MAHIDTARIDSRHFLKSPRPPSLGLFAFHNKTTNHQNRHASQRSKPNTTKLGTPLRRPAIARRPTRSPCHRSHRLRPRSESPPLPLLPKTQLPRIAPPQLGRSHRRTQPGPSHRQPTTAVPNPRSRAPKGTGLPRPSASLPKQSRTTPRRSNRQYRPTGAEVNHGDLLPLAVLGADPALTENRRVAAPPSRVKSAYSSFSAGDSASPDAAPSSEPASPPSTSIESTSWFSKKYLGSRSTAGTRNSRLLGRCT